VPLRLVGLQLRVIIGGDIVIEVVFSYPGMCQLFFQAALDTDVQLMLAITMAIIAAGQRPVRRYLAMSRQAADAPRPSAKGRVLPHAALRRVTGSSCSYGGQISGNVVRSAAGFSVAA